MFSVMKVPSPSRERHTFPNSQHKTYYEVLYVARRRHPTKDLNLPLFAFYGPQILHSLPTARPCQVSDDLKPCWACTTNGLPDNVALGTVEVSCEGYKSPSDPYVLVGSCGLTYTLDGAVPA